MTKLESKHRIAQEMPKSLSLTCAIKMTLIVSYDILCCCGKFYSDTLYEQVYKFSHPKLLLVHPVIYYENEVRHILCILPFL